VSAILRMSRGFGIAMVPLSFRVGLTRHRGRFQYLGKPVALDADPLGKLVHASSSWRFAALIRRCGRGLGYLDAHLKHGFVDGAAQARLRPRR
jgi:hypothetical protein